MSPKRILVVEDEMLVALDIESTLTELGHAVSVATSCTEALAIVDAGGVAFAVIDYHLRDGTTDELATRLRNAGVPFIVCSGTAGLIDLGEPFSGAMFLAKPFSTDRLIEAVMDLTAGADAVC